MDHTCWAHSRLKKCPGLKIKSQWSFTLYRSLITTLYVHTIVSFDTTLNFDHKEHFYLWLTDLFLFKIDDLALHLHHCIGTFRILFAVAWIILLLRLILVPLRTSSAFRLSDVMSQLPDFFSLLYLDIISKDWGKSGNWRDWGLSPTLCNP